MIWEPFVLALVLGLVVSAGLYFAYLWPSVEPIDDSTIEPGLAAADSRDTPEVDAPEPPRVKPPVVAAVPEARKEPPLRPSDADMTPLPPPQPEDDGLDDKAGT